MPITMRVSLPGYDCLTDGTIDHYSIYADSDNVLIKEHSRGVGTATYGNSGTITHNLGYIPFYLAYTEINANTYRLTNSFYTLSPNWQVTAGTANLVATNNGATLRQLFRYYIFYDDIT